MKKPKKNRLLSGCLTLAGLSIVCLVLSTIYSWTPAGKAAATARSLTETAAQTSTDTPSRNIDLSTALAADTETPAPTETLKPASTKKTSTNTPAVLITFAPTDTLQVFNPTKAPPAEAPVCACDGSLNCGDFKRRRAAQACYDFCKAKGLGDIHNLDGNDKDGKACETLP